MYKRPWYVRLIRRHGSIISTVTTSTAAALLFSSLFVAMLLSIGFTDSSGPAVSDPMSSRPPFATDTTATDNGDPRPLIVASGVGLDLQEGER